jgi:hypothetical protein
MYFENRLRLEINERSTILTKIKFGLIRIINFSNDLKFGLIRIINFSNDLKFGLIRIINFSNDLKFGLISDGPGLTRLRGTVAWIHS